MLNKEKLVLGQKIKINGQDLKIQRLLVYFFILVRMFVIAFSIVFCRRWKITFKQLRLIEQQKTFVDEAILQLVKKINIIALKDKVLTDNVIYAIRIKDSLLPSEKHIEKNLRGLENEK